LKYKIVVCIVLILVSSIFLSGCVSRNTTIDDYYTQNSDGSLHAVINAPEKSYFGEKIEFDASQSYDTNGKIVRYIWNFMNKETVEGKTVEHTFEFDNDYNTKFPVIYTVTLFLMDNEGSIQPSIHHIMLYPKSYHFYFSSNKISNLKPTSYSEKLSSGELFNIDFTKKISYNLDDSIEIPSSNWNLNLEIEKPFFSIINKISVSFLNEKGEKLFEKSYKPGLISFISKNIELTDTLGKNIDLKSINVELSGINLDAVSVVYGSDLASGITFNIN